MNILTTPKIIFLSLAIGFSFALVSAMFLAFAYQSGEFSLDTAPSLWGGFGALFLMSFLFVFFTTWRLNSERRFCLEGATRIHALMDSYHTFSYFKYTTAFGSILMIGFHHYMTSEPSLSWRDFAMGHGVDYIYQFAVFLMVYNWFFPIHRRLKNRFRVKKSG